MKNQMWFWLVAAALALAFYPAGQRNIAPAAEPRAADKPAVHNMLVAGEKAVYISHLPMFQEKGQPPMPHRYQAIIEVVFTGGDSGPQQAYAEDRRKHREVKIYTLSPEKFVLPTLVSTDSPSKPLRSFKAEIFRGHLEKPGNARILREVAVEVKNVVYFREFDHKAQKPSQLEYLLFGKEQELFLAHLITKAPDFDQVVAVKVTGHAFTDDELAKGVQIVFPKTKNAAAARLKEGQTIAGKIGADSASASKMIQVEIAKELYFEEGELRVPPNFNTTPEERRAGFP